MAGSSWVQVGKFEETSTGDGNLKLGGVDAGFIRNCSFQLSGTDLELWTGIPEQFQGSHPQRRGASFTCDVLEFSMVNLGKITGQAVTVVFDDPVNVEDQLLTFAAPGNYDGALERIFLDGPGATSIVVEPEGGGAPYVAGTDYLLDGTSAGIIRLAGGAITTKATVQVSYTYTPVESTEIRGGVNFARQRFALEFTHPKFTKGTNLVLSHSKVEPAAELTIPFASGDFNAPNVTFNFIRDDAGSPSWPLYRLREVAAS